MPDAVANKKPNAEPNPDRHKYPLVSLRPPIALRNAVAALAKRERRSLSQMAMILLEEALQGRGLYEPPESEFEAG